MNRRRFLQATPLSGLAVLAESTTTPQQPSGSTPADADFYVAPEGDDSNPGTLSKPFRTLSRARDGVFQLKSGSKRKKRPIVVMLRGGTYYLRQSVAFSSQDSGTHDEPIIYAAYPGEHPLLSGGMQLTGWKLYKDRIYATELPKREDQYYGIGQLFFNGKRQTRSRWPNRDSGHPDYGGFAFVESTEPAESTAPVFFRWESGVSPNKWAKPEQGEVFIIPGLAWVSQIIPIRTVDHDKRLISVTRRLATRWDRLTKGNRFYIENLLEELDTPGEWCFDSDTSTVYFWPPEGIL